MRHSSHHRLRFVDGLFSFASRARSRWNTTTSARTPSPDLNSFGRAPFIPPLQMVNVSPSTL